MFLTACARRHQVECPITSRQLTKACIPTPRNIIAPARRDRTQSLSIGNSDAQPKSTCCFHSLRNNAHLGTLQSHFEECYMTQNAHFRVQANNLTMKHMSHLYSVVSSVTTSRYCPSLTAAEVSRVSDWSRATGPEGMRNRPTDAEQPRRHPRNATGYYHKVHPSDVFTHPTYRGMNIFSA